MSCFGGGGGAPQEDPTVVRQRKQHSQEIDQDLQRYKREFESTHRLLLLGEETSNECHTQTYAHTYIHTYIHGMYVPTYVCVCDCRSVNMSEAISCVCPKWNVLLASVNCYVWGG